MCLNVKSIRKKVRSQIHMGVHYHYHCRSAGAIKVPHGKNEIRSKGPQGKQGQQEITRIIYKIYAGILTTKGLSFLGIIWRLPQWTGVCGFALYMSG